MESRFDFVAFVFAHKAVVDEDTGQLAAYGLRNKGRRNRAVYAARQSQYDLAVADGLLDRFDSHLGIVGHRPGTGAAADFKEEIMKHFLAVFRMEHFRMVLHSIKLFRRILHSRYGAVIRIGDDFKAFGNVRYIVRMAHPYDFLFLQAFKQRGRRVDGNRRLAEFAHFRRLHLAAQGLSHELHAVAQAEDRDSQVKYFFFNLRRIVLIHAGRAACKDNALRLHFLYFGQSLLIRVYFAVHMVFTDAARNKLIILTAKIDNNNEFFVIHFFLLIYDKISQAAVQSWFYDSVIIS